MKTFALAVLLGLCGCGARVEVPAALESDAEPEQRDVQAADTTPSFGGGGGGGGGGTTDAGAPSDASKPVPSEDTMPPDPGDGPRITSLDACGSDVSVDKIIAHTSVGIRPFAPGVVAVFPGGTKCPEVFPGSSMTGEYAFAAKCGLVDKSMNIVVVVRDGVTSFAGKPMTPGTYTFVPTGKSGRLCGNEFRPAL